MQNPNIRIENFHFFGGGRLIFFNVSSVVETCVGKLE